MQIATPAKTLANVAAESPICEFTARARIITKGTAIPAKLAQTTIADEDVVRRRMAIALLPSANRTLKKIRAGRQNSS
jgi:hypothetical protein